MNVVTNIGVLGYEKKQKFLSASLDWCRHCAPVNKGKVDLTGRIFFTFLLDPSRSSLECRLANKVDDGSGDGSLELDVTGVKDPRASGLGGMVLQMPMPRNIVKVAALVVIESPGHAILGRAECVIVERCVLNKKDSEGREESNGREKADQHMKTLVFQLVTVTTSNA